MKKVGALLLTLYVAVSYANPGGVGDQNTSCIDGHTRVGPCSIWFDTSTPTTVQEGDTIEFKIWVNLDVAVGRHMAGVMLLTGDGRMITEDGWQLISDPNGNNPPFNYNERDSLNGNNLFVWRAIVPHSTEDKTVKARVMYGHNGRGYHNETDILDINVSSITEDQTDSSTNFDAEVRVHGDQLEIRYQAPSNAKMMLTIYDFSGRALVKGLEWISNGRETKYIPIDYLPSGYYLVIVRADEQSKSFKVLKLENRR